MELQATMHVWFLILPVLATFPPIVQVASTEDQSWKFIEAISPLDTIHNRNPQPTQLTQQHQQQQLHQIATINLPNSLNTNTQITTYKNSDSKTITTTTTTNIMKYSENKQDLHDNEVILLENEENVQQESKNEQIKQINKIRTSDEKTSIIENNHINNKSVDENNNNIIEKVKEEVAIEEEGEEEEPVNEQQLMDTHESELIDNQKRENSLTYSNKEIIGEKVTPDPSTLVQIENSLLSLFNMKRPPKIDRSKIIVPEAMKKLYAQIMGHELDSVNIPKPGLLTKSANTVRSFTHQDSKIDDRFPHHHRFRLHFDVKSIPAEEKLKAAELQLTRDEINQAILSTHLANRVRYQILVYDITRVGVRGKREPSYLLLDNKTVRLNSTDTVSLDVQPAVNRWMENPKQNYGVLVEVRTSRSLKPAPHHHVRLRRSITESHESWQHKQPLLFTYTDDGRHKSRSIRDVSTRSKRAGHHRRPHRRKNNEEICRRHSLYVDFADVGWSDWIVAPPGYDAFYCHGKCPFPLADHLNSTNHAVVQTLVNNLNPGKVPKACCVPTQLEGIAMLYLNDQSTVVLKNYQDMTVVGCGCR